MVEYEKDIVYILLYILGKPYSLITLNEEEEKNTIDWEVSKIIQLLQIKDIGLNIH